MGRLEGSPEVRLELRSGDLARVEVGPGSGRAVGGHEVTGPSAWDVGQDEGVAEFVCQAVGHVAGDVTLAPRIDLG